MYFYFLLFFSFYLISGEELYHGCTDIKPLLLLLLLLLLCGPPCPYLLANMDPFIPPPPSPQNLFCFVSPQRLQRQPNNVLKIFSNYSSNPLLIITTYRDEIPK